MSAVPATRTVVTINPELDGSFIVNRVVLAGDRVVKTATVATTPSFEQAGRFARELECTTTQSQWQEYDRRGLCKHCHLPSACHEY